MTTKTKIASLFTCFIFLFCCKESWGQSCEARFGFQFNGLTVSFTDSSTGNPTNYLWNFGDGAVSIQPNPTHTYNHPGNYPVRLIVSGGVNCSDTLFRRLCVQCVRPGDANNDFLVDNKDVLYVGLAYGAIGPVRQDSVNSSQPVLSVPWVSPTGVANFQGGTNIKHADCDGNGIVNRFDLRPIQRHYNQSFMKSGGVDCVDPDDVPLYFEVLDSVPIGSSVFVSVKLGDNLNPALDVYGIAYTINYEPYLIDSGSVDINYGNSLLGTSSDIIFLNQDFHGDGKIESGLSRIDHNNIDVAGTIGVLEFVMEDNLAQKRFLTDVLNLSFSDVFLIQNDETVVPVCAYHDSTVVYQKAVTSSGPIFQKQGLRIYPNPASERVFVELPGGNYEVSVVDPIGKMLMQDQFEGNKVHSVDIVKWPAGIYFILVKNEQNVFSYKLKKSK